MSLEMIQDEINARALGVALLEPSIDSLCYRVAALSIGVERLTELVHAALNKANQESNLSTIALELMQGLEPLIAKGAKFPAGRDKGSISARTRHISKLVEDYPTLKSKEIMQRADKDLIGNMPATTFSNKVSIARKKK